MKRILKAVLIIAGIAAVIGLGYWQLHKRGFIKGAIKSAVENKTDSLYYISYDSSYVDEVGGNASFYNVALQSDSAQNLMLKNTDSLPSVLYNIRVKEVTVKGVDIAGFAAKERVAAAVIYLKEPVIRIIKTGSSKDSTNNNDNDTLEIYKKLTGKFNSINAGRIEIENATIVVTNRNGEVSSQFKGINIGLNNFVVDENHDYQNIISYFIKDVHANLSEVDLPKSPNGTQLSLYNVTYDAAKRVFHIDSLKQFDMAGKDSLIFLKNIHIDSLNTEDFVRGHLLHAGSISCDGGLLTIYRKNKVKKDNEEAVVLYDNLVEGVRLSGIKIGSTKVVVVNTAKPNEKPFELNNVRFDASKIEDIKEGITITGLINTSAWQLSADGISLFTKDKLYKISTGSFTIDNGRSVINIENIKVKPQVSEKEFVAQRQVQGDMYNLEFNNIVISNINTQKLIKENELEIGDISWKGIIRIFNDKTLPFDTNSKVGKYPHQLLLKLPLQYFIKTIHFSDTYVSYRERARKSALVGDVTFSHLTAVLSNVTNISANIKNDPTLRLQANTTFIGAGKLTTEWLLPLDKYDSTFTYRGELSGFDAVKLNAIIKPLGMASVDKGYIDKLSFDMTGANYQSSGIVNFLYHDIKVNMLKKDDDNSLEKKDVTSFIANLLIKKNNKDINNKAKVNYNRDTTKSFFNLLWKSIFTGVKQTVI